MAELQNFPFNETKAVQAAALFAARTGNQINYMKLIKLIYLLDREALKRWGVPIVGGNYVSMDQGPVASPVLDAIKSPAQKFPLWTSHFRKEGYDVRLIHGIEPDDLSPAELEVLDWVFSRFGAMDQWQLVYYTHENCGEWVDPQGTSLPIKPSAILQNVGKTEQIDVLAAELSRIELVDKLFAKL
ncbi:MAG TPA: Panacea domain-containing protein [Elusimicrobiota bacterium]|nr:Panacea domain-containing protein [Elusimicrobiota bacterium]